MKKFYKKPIVYVLALSAFIFFSSLAKADTAPTPGCISGCQYGDAYGTPVIIKGGGGDLSLPASDLVCSGGVFYGRMQLDGGATVDCNTSAVSINSVFGVSVSSLSSGWHQISYYDCPAGDYNGGTNFGGSNCSGGGGSNIANGFFVYPRSSLWYGISSNLAPNMTAIVSDQFSDPGTMELVALCIGIPLFFVIVQYVLGLFYANKRKK